MVAFPKRGTAYKFWIKDIINAVPIDREGMHLFEVRGKETSRVNIIATVVDKMTNEENRCINNCHPIIVYFWDY